MTKRIALLADQLLTPTGSEQLFLSMVETFPDADIYTLTYNPELTLQEFRQYNIRQHWAHSLFPNHKLFKLLFLPATLFMQWWTLPQYDIVLISSATTAKYVRKRKGTRYICYCFFPTRAIWRESDYFRKMRKSLAHSVFHAMLPWLKRRDRTAARSLDHIIAISQTSREAIQDYYDRDSEVLFCPIRPERFLPGLKEEKKNFYLIVSRLEQWKCLDYAIEAFNYLGLPLVLVGEGEDGERLRVLAGRTVTFLGNQSMEDLALLYGQAKAVIFTPPLEYGLVPIEACAAGTPVIALGYGGVLETMVGTGSAKPLDSFPTAVFFSEPTAESLAKAVLEFQSMTFDRTQLVDYANTFSLEAFQRKLRQIVVANST